MLDKSRKTHRLRMPVAAVGLAAIFASLALAVPSHAAPEPPTDPATVLATSPTEGDLVRYALENNPEIAAQRSAWKAVAERYRLTTSWPDPQLMVTYFPEPIETRLGPQDWNANLSQMIPLFGELDAKGAVVEVGAEAERIRLDQTARDIAVSVRESAYELWYIRQALEVARGQEQLVDQMRTLAETAHAEDRAQLVDVVKAQSQEGQVLYDRLLLEELEATERANLNALLNRPSEATIGPVRVGPVAKLALRVEQLIADARANREEIKLGKTMVRAAEAQQSRDRFDNYPDVKVGLFYAGIGDPDVPSPPRDAGRDAVGVQVGVSIPLWWGRNEARVEQWEARKNEARSRVAAMENKTGAMVHTLLFKLRSAERLLTLYGSDLLPQARSAMSQAETLYREGTIGFSDFIEAQSAHYNFNLSYLRARADYGKVLARLEGLVGRAVTVDGDETGGVQ